MGGCGGLRGRGEWVNAELEFSSIFVLIYGPMIKRKLGLEALLAFHHALSDETRVRIVNLLLERPCCVKEIAEALQVPQPRVSQHLAILRAFGLVKVKKEGNLRRYSLNYDKYYKGMFDCILGTREICEVLREDLRRLGELVKGC